jgi:membrane fusion protein (multidrug efflux system)
LSFTEIRAPFSGTIDRIPKKSGSLIDEGELLTSLLTTVKIYTYFNVSDLNILNQNNIMGRRYWFTLQIKYTEKKVELIEAEFDSETGILLLGQFS